MVAVWLKRLLRWKHLRLSVHLLTPQRPRLLQRLRQKKRNNRLLALR